MKKYFLILFIVSFIVYNLNCSFLRTTYLTGHADTTSNRLLPFNILSGRGIYFDQIIKELYHNQRVPYYVQKVGSHYLPSFPMVPGLMALPFYLPVYLLLKLQHLDQIAIFFNSSLILEKLVASFYASLNVSLFFILMYQLSNKRIKISFIFALIYAFATQQFSINSQSLWQADFVNLFLIISQILFLKGLTQTNTNKKKRLFVSSLLVAYLTVLSRHSMIVYYFLYLGILSWVDKKQLKTYLSIFILSLLFYFGFNIYFYHSLAGDYRPFLYDFYQFSLRNVIDHILGIFVSPGKGMIFYTPFYLFGFFSIIYLKKIKQKIDGLENFWYLNFFHILTIIVLISTKIDWFGGEVWGNRFLSDCIVSIIILIYYFYIFNKNYFLKVVLFTFVIYSFFVQIVGTFYYPKAEWYGYPTNKITTLTARIWNFYDNPLQRNLAIGPETSGYSNFINIIIGKWIENKQYSGLETKCSLYEISEESLLEYKEITLNIINRSPVDWLTTTFNGPNINLKQFFVNRQTHTTIESPLVAKSLPRLIKSGESVEAKVLIVPPSKDKYDVFIFPVQDNVSSWQKSCSYKTQIN